jgi:hypothetical protein
MHGLERATIHPLVAAELVSFDRQARTAAGLTRWQCCVLHLASPLPFFSVKSITVIVLLPTKRYKQIDSAVLGWARVGDGSEVGFGTLGFAAVLGDVRYPRHPSGRACIAE